MTMDAMFSAVIMLVIVGGVACWLWRITRLHTSDYDIEGFLQGKWEMVNFAPLGRACQSRKRLVGEWSGLRVIVDLCVGRAALMSLFEEYCVEIKSRTPSPGNDSKTAGMAEEQPATLLSPDLGDWEVSRPGAGRAVARARFRVPVGRRVLTPTSSRRAMESVLSVLQRQLQKG